MKIAVVSDSHDHLENIGEAVSVISGSGAEILLHCGDLCSPFTIDPLALFSGQVHIVFGNNDGDRYAISKMVKRFDKIHLHGELGTIETGSGRIAFTHRPEFAAGLAATGEYSAVFSGHTHIGKIEKAGGVLLVNPGDLMGLIEKPGFAIYDTESEIAELVSMGVRPPKHR